MLRETWGTLWSYWPGSLSCPSSPEHALSMWKQVSCKQCCRGQLSSFRLYPWPVAIQAAGFQDKVSESSTEWIMVYKERSFQFLFFKSLALAPSVFSTCARVSTPAPCVYIYNCDFLIPSSSVGGNRWHMSGVPLVPLPQNVVRKPDF